MLIASVALITLSPGDEPDTDPISERLARRIMEVLYLCIILNRVVASIARLMVLLNSLEYQ